MVVVQLHNHVVQDEKEEEQSACKQQHPHSQ